MTRADPQRTTGDTAGYARLPNCRCGHLATVHDRHSKARTSPCSTADPEKCPCTTYRPVAAP